MTGLSLEAFAEENGEGPRRMTMDQMAKQPEWESAVLGWKRGMRAVTIRRWLVKECGYADKVLPSADSFQRYFRENYA